MSKLYLTKFGKISQEMSTVISVQTSLSITFIVLITYLIGIGNSFESTVYGHDFVPNESASFLSLMNQSEAESGLVQTNLVNGNVSLAEEHAARAVGLLNS